MTDPTSRNRQQARAGGGRQGQPGQASYGPYRATGLRRTSTRPGHEAGEITGETDPNTGRHYWLVPVDVEPTRR